MNRRRFLALASLGALAVARGKLPTMPPAAAPVYPLAAEGSFLFVDGGTLDLGIVRDTAFDVTNRYQVFGETFENVRFAGRENIMVTSTAVAA